MKNLNNSPENIWEYEVEVYNRLTAEDIRYSLMPAAERKFINGMIRYFKPHRILELGVCDGGGSIVILNAITDMLETKLISIDVVEVSTMNKQLPCGHAAIAKYPNTRQWELHTGKEPAEIMDSIASEGKFDLVVIDTLHRHPGETLNFLTILPHLQENAIVIVQDISLYVMSIDFHLHWFLPFSNFPNINLAPRLLFDTVVGEKLTLPVGAYKEDKNWIIEYSNIGAIQINNDTKKYVGNLFSILEFPWGVLPLKIAAVSQYLKKHYDESLFKKYQYAFRKNTRLVYNKGILYHYTKNDIDFAQYDKVIFYGCGQCLKGYLNNYNNIPVIPDEIWDNNAEFSHWQCIPVNKPDYSISHKENVAVVISIYDGPQKNQVKELLVNNGFTSIFDINQCY